MAGGLTDHMWTVQELLKMLVIPAAINTQEGDDQISFNLTGFLS